MNHLEAARECIAIAESGDAKHAAYKAAAEHVAAELQLRTISNRQIAREIGKDESFVRALRRWRDSGYEAATPWLSDGEATARAAKSHTRKFLREAPVEEIEQAMVGLPPERRSELAGAFLETSPAHTTKPPLGVRESIKRMEKNTSLTFLIGGPLADVDEGIEKVGKVWDEHAYDEGRTDEERQIVQDEIRESADRLLAIINDPRELLA
jgi:hypothetical protein